MPSDFSALFTLGITTSIVSIFLLLGFAFVLFAPTWVYQHGLSDSDPEFKRVNRTRASFDLAGLQFGAIGIFFLSIAYDEKICNGSPTLWLAFGLVFVGWGICSLTRFTRIPTGYKKRMWSFVCALIIGLCGLVPIAALIPIQLVLIPDGEAAALALIGLFVFVILFNAFVAPTPSGRTAGAFALAFTMYLLVVLPLIGSNPILFPTLVAQALGIRESAIQDLRLPKRTCQLILATIKYKSFDNIRCQSDEWNEVKAQVLSNVGERWVIEIRQEGEAIDGEVVKLRITIPREGVQVVREIRSPLNQERQSNCNKSS